MATRLVIDAAGRRAVMRVIALLVGIAAIALGGMALSVELSRSPLAADRVSGLVLVTILISSGVVICALALSRYRGGLATLLGVLLSMFAITCIAVWVVAHRSASGRPTFGLLVILQATVSAVVLFYIGHRQHRVLPALSYESKLPRYAFLAGAFLVVFSAGVAGGYYLGWRPAKLAQLEVFRALEAEELQEGNSSLMALNLIADGRENNAYRDAEFRVIRMFGSAEYLSRGNGKHARQYADFRAAVIDFYQRHPERLASLRERYAKYPALIEGIDTKH